MRVISYFLFTNVENMFGSFGGNWAYTSLDLEGAYNQLEDDENSQLLTTINTMNGLYIFKRLKTCLRLFKPGYPWKSETIY